MQRNTLNSLASQLGIIADPAANYWATGQHTPRAWNGILPARYFDSEDFHGERAGGWVTFPTNQNEWDLVFAAWCRKLGISHECIKANPDEPTSFMLWIEFLEEFPLRSAQWNTFQKVMQDA